MQYTAIIKDGGLFIPNIMVHRTNLSSESLVKVNLELLDDDVTSPKTEEDLTKSIMAFAGCWKDLDDDLFSTDDISKRRESSSRERYL